MRNKIFYLLFIVVASFTSCDNRPDNVLSSGQMTDFLVELHRLDGTLNVKGMGNANDRRNIYYYNSLLNKYHITKADFDSSLVWYSQNPKRFDRIYAEVLSRLNEEEKKVNSGFYHPVDSQALRHSKLDIWPLPECNYTFTKDSSFKKLSFVVKNTELLWNDTYVLSFLHRFGKSNMAVGQQAVIRLHYSDKKTDSIVCKTISDSLLRRYTITLRARRLVRIDSISGTLMDFKGEKGHVAGYIDSIKLIKKYDSVARDSIVNALQLIENPAQVVKPVMRKLLRLRSRVLNDSTSLYEKQDARKAGDKINSSDDKEIIRELNERHRLQQPVNMQ